MIVYAVFEVSDFQGAVEIKTLLTLHTTRADAERLASHLEETEGKMFGYLFEIEELEVL